MAMKNVKATGKVVFEKSFFMNKNEKHKNLIANHSLNSQVQILIPNQECIPADVDDILSNEMAYLARQVPLSLLLDPEFILGFVKSGSIHMLSHGTCVDFDDCVALLPTGKLLLSLTPDTYQNFGLEGRMAKTGKPKSAVKRVVEIDLINNFKPGSKLYKRVKWCMTDRVNLHFDFTLTWAPADDKVCASSIQNFFTTNKLMCNRIKLHRKRLQYANIKVPIFSCEEYQPDGESDVHASCDYMEVFEWLGACALGIDMCAHELDDYVSSYTCPCPNKDLAHCISTQYTSMFSINTIQRVVDKLRIHMKNKKLPWCSITVHGFMDSPVAWQHDHGFHRNGDNLYTLVLFENEDYWQYSAIGAQDVCL